MTPANIGAFVGSDSGARSANASLGFKASANNSRSGGSDSKEAGHVFISLPLGYDSYGTVYAFPNAQHNPPPSKEIVPKEPLFVLGLTTDSAENLYITYTQTGVAIFKPPYSPKDIIANIGNVGALEDYDVAVSADGLIAVVADAISAASQTEIQFYSGLKSTQYPCAVVSDPPLLQYANFAAFDGNDDLYVDGVNGAQQASYGKISGGCSATAFQVLNLKKAPSIAAGLQIDHSGNLAIIDPVNKVVDTYSTSTLKKVGSTPLKSASYPQDFAFDSSGNDIYTADRTLGLSQEYGYPRGGAVKNTFSPNPSSTPAPEGAYGVAVTPILAQ
jgi:hypothetical protein